MKKYLRLYKTFFRINLMKALAYRGNFLVSMLLVIIESITVLIGVDIMFNHIQDIAGWNQQDMWVLSGVFMITHALSWLLYKASINNLDRLINDGDLDSYLIKPIDTQFIATVHKIDIEDAARSIAGIGVIILGLQGASLFHLITGIPLFIITVLAGQVVLYGITLAIKSISFKSIQGWGTNAIFWRFHDLARYPTDIYRGIIRLIYTYIFPLIFIATVPAQALIGNLSLALCIGSLIAAMLAWYISRKIWLYALNSYSSASS